MGSSETYIQNCFWPNREKKIRLQSTFKNLIKLFFTLVMKTKAVIKFDGVIFSGGASYSALVSHLRDFRPTV